MQNFPKIGLPVIFIIVAIILLISKSAVTIGPGEGGVLFERFGDGILVVLALCASPLVKKHCRLIVEDMEQVFGMAK